MGAEDQGSSDLDDLMETLSLCDLPMYGDDDDGGGHWDDFSKDDHSSSTDEELFEFFSEDFSASAWPAAESIVFCGKLIPYKKLPGCTDAEENEDGTAKKHKQKQQQQQTEKRGFLGLKSFSIGKKSRSKSMDDDSHRKGLKKLQQAPGSKSFPAPRQSSSSAAAAAADKFDFTFPKVSVPTHTHKSQWQVFFEPARVPGEMKLRDIKKRQNRRTPAVSPKERKIEGGEKRNGKKLWGLLRILGCGISRANTVAKASLSLRWVESLPSLPHSCP